MAGFKVWGGKTVVLSFEAFGFVTSFG